MPKLPTRSLDELPKDDAALLSPAEAAAFLKCSTFTLGRWRRLKKGPPYIRLSGARVAYRRGALNAWLDEYEVAS